MKPITQTLRRTISTAVKTAYAVELPADTIRLEHPADESNGDYASNIAMALAGKLKQKPMEIALQLAKRITEGIEGEGGIEGIEQMIENVQAAAPGFLNFRLKPEYLIATAEQISKPSSEPFAGVLGTYQSAHPFKGKKIMVEFAHPNTHKEFHIGHLRNICIGESLIRTLEACRATVFRANYEGDVGLHVAKAIWGIYRKIQNARFKMKNEGDYLYALNELTKDMTAAQKAEFLGQGYALGSKAYEEDTQAKKEIIELNKRIITDPQAVPLWKETRQMSLEYFDTVYKRLGSHFDRLFFESEVEKPGRQLVIDGVKKGIFIKDADGSIYFPGETFGLNNCVFVTRENYATYEGKDVALEHLEYQTFPYDLDIHVVANEQINFFHIAFAALEQLFSYQKGRQYHLAYGMVKLKSGKMSSRTGEVITADALIDMAKEKIRLISQSTNQPINQSTNDATNEETVEKIAVAAVKYTMLRVNPKQDIAFDLAGSVSLEGDSGPYLLYTYVRCTSVMRKAETVSAGQPDRLPTSPTLPRSLKEINEEELALLRHFYRFWEVVEEAAKTYSPNLICAFLFDVAQKFNGFYNKHSILGISNQGLGIRKKTAAPRTLIPDNSSFRLLLTETTAAVLKRGLYLLGIETVERM